MIYSLLLILYLLLGDWEALDTQETGYLPDHIWDVEEVNQEVANEWDRQNYKLIELTLLNRFIRIEPRVEGQGTDRKKEGNREVQVLEDSASLLGHRSDDLLRHVQTEECTGNEQDYRGSLPRQIAEVESHNDVQVYQ